MIATDIMEIGPEDLERMEQLVDFANSVFDSHRYLLTNRDMILRFELGMEDPDNKFVISGINCYGAIVLRVSAMIISANCIINTYLYQLIVGEEYADDQEVIRKAEDRLYTLFFAFTVLHEMVHAGQQIPVGNQYIPQEAITFEDSADYYAAMAIREEYGAKEYEVAMLFENSYGRRFLVDYAPPTPDNLFAYYNETLKIIFCVACSSMDRDVVEYPADMLYSGLDFCIINELNNIHAEIKIRHNGVLMRPTADYILLLRLLIFSGENSCKIKNAMEVDNENQVVIFRLSGTALIIPFTEDILEYYGLQSVDTEALEEGKLRFRSNKES